MMNERDMMRGVDWQGEPVAGTYASRKLNGVALLWDGAQGWTRSGNLVALPPAIRDTLPAMRLDCEIISGDGNNAGFSAASVAVRLNRWTPDIHAVAFDAPEAAGDWAQRIETARAAGVETVRWWTSAGEGELLADLLRILNADGEGLIIRAPGTGYCCQITRQILKVKRASLSWLYEMEHSAIYAVQK